MVMIFIKTILLYRHILIILLLLLIKINFEIYNNNIFFNFNKKLKLTKINIITTIQISDIYKAFNNQDIDNNIQNYIQQIHYRITPLLF